MANPEGDQSRKTVRLGNMIFTLGNPNRISAEEYLRRVSLQEDKFLDGEWSSRPIGLSLNGDPHEDPAIIPSVPAVAHLW